MTSKPKRKAKESGSGSYNSKMKKIDEALGVSFFEIAHDYKPYSILNRFVQDRKTKEWVELKNKEKPRELLDYLLNVGNAKSFKVRTNTEAEEAINFVFERDHAWAKALLNGQIKIEDLGALRIPEIFLSKVPHLIDYDAFTQKHKIEIAKAKAMSKPPIEKFPISKQGQDARYTYENNVPVPTDHGRDGDLSGDKWERFLYYSLKKYFEDTKDACLIIHGHSFLHEDNFKEKDFIVLNLSKGYIMNIEVKASHKHFDNAKKQIKDCRKRIQAVLDCIPGMSSLWKFIGVCCIGDGCFDNDFVINGSDLESDSYFDRKLCNIQKKVDVSSWSPNDNRINEFVEIAKHLLFVAQGQSKVPLTKEKLTEKVNEDMDKASAPENILFWTPEQLSIVQAMDIDWMFLMAYYGCGKTILLIERAEYLLRNPCNTIYFLIDNNNSGLNEVLKLRFADRNIKIKEKGKYNIFDRDFDFSKYGVHLTDHVIVDEARMEHSETVLTQLKKFQSQISTLWVALGYVDSDANFNECDFRVGLNDINFSCPTMTNCLRNGQKIVELAQTGLGEGLNCFVDQVKVKSKRNVNDGLLHEMSFIYSDPIKALQEAFKGQDYKNSFIFMEKEGLEMSDLKEAIPGHDFVNFQNKEGLKKWLKASNMNQHLVLEDGNLYNSEVDGMEFQSMIYLSSICLKCGFEYKNSSVITRAKASLLLARYEKQNCCFCGDAIYPNLKWDKESTKWEIEDGITKDQLSEESRGILEKTSELRSLLFMS